jgi:amidase
MNEDIVKIDRDQHVWSFDSQREPIVTVEPGTLIEIETWDCFTGQVQTEKDTLEKLDLSRVNSATGPIAVRGAEPGDTLSVTLLDIRPGSQGAAMCIPGWGQLIHQVESPTTRIFKVADGAIRMNDRVSFPIRPMFGVIGVSPESGDVSTFFADRHGGNMDDRMNGIGATVHLPVFQSGGQLAIGDMHASMGDGEISGTGVEIGGSALIKVDIIKDKRGGWPITETADSFYTHGTSPDNIDDALEFACEEASKLLVDEWGFSSEDAFMFLSVVGDLGISAYYHPSPGSIVARMRVPKLASNPHPFRT